MSKVKKPLIFTLALLPIAALAGYFVAMYQLELYDQETIDALISQAGSRDTIILLSVIQTLVFTFICGFLGYIISEKIGLMKPFRLERLDWQPFFGQIYTEHKTSFITPGLSPFSLGL